MSNNFGESQCTFVFLIMQMIFVLRLEFNQPNPSGKKSKGQAFRINYDYLDYL